MVHKSTDPQVRSPGEPKAVRRARASSRAWGPRALSLEAAVLAVIGSVPCSGETSARGTLQGGANSECNPNPCQSLYASISAIGVACIAASNFHIYGS